ncbi:XLF-domain-containing protein [Massarina eburnea CBS 473.64]|uniref:Non-homologous end-joining factor 1 n=1 Tax=Massarina eburnea CBS 473.64 TaxID=1395130 RepID=A0A6A6SE45_9PLEO|nr:XLF-domain-containing protein [Massarina eburnea CBS 473.64]
MSCWRVLELHDQPQIPQLLVKAHFSPDAYTVHLTDLTNIWSEELDLDSIIERASASESPIDVSKQDTTQLAILLESVRKSLAGTSDTRCRMTCTDGEGIILHTTISLPEPLDSLRWKFCLRKRGSVVLRNELILPLLVSSHIQHDRVNWLVSTVLEKDRVIARLVDQLESNNLDLAAAFPTISGSRPGRRLGKREQAAKYVSGLQAFDEDVWKKETADLQDSNVSTLGLFREALAECTPHVPPRLKSTDGDDTWWTAIGSTLATPKLSRISISKASAVAKKSEALTPAADSETDEDETEDEFETDAKFKLRNTSKRPARASEPAPESALIDKPNDVNENATTDDEEDDDLDAPPKSQSQSYTRQAPPKARSLTLEPSPEPSPPKEKTPPVQKPKARGFRIGGKAKKAETLPPAPEEALDDRKEGETAEPPAGSNATKKSFKIGGKAKATANERSTSAVKDEDVPTRDVEETAEEKAERRRRELKRKNEELAKKQAQGKKKKKRF